MATPGQIVPPPPHPQPQPPPQQQPPQTQSHLQQVDFDPVSRFKLLIPRLKESLVNLIKVAAEAFRQTSLLDSGTKSTENMQQRFEKSLEEFYAICDQIEVNLRLALEMSNQVMDGNRFTPVPVVTNKSENQSHDSQCQTYSQYMSTVRTQITSAKEIHDLLMDCVRKLVDKQ